MALPAPPRLAAKLLLWGASASLLAAQHAAADQRAHPITAHLAARILPADAPPIDTGVLLEQGGKILAVGPRSSTPIPKDAKVQDHGNLWLCPGFVDLHHHVSGGGGDINDMVAPLNAEMRTLDVVKPSEESIRRAAAGGVTTTLFIPGSGTNIGGFGVLLKMRWGGSLEAMVIRELGAMKVAQGFNPERRSGDLGLSRMGSSELLVQLLERGRDYAAAWRAFAAGTGDKPKFDASLEQLRLVFDKKVPVLIHTAGARDCIATARMFQDVFDVRMVLSHGCFDGWVAATALAKRQTPVNLGPRMYEFDKYGRFQGTCQAYWDAGCHDMSINTDAPVVAAEELQLQAAMAIRLGLDYEVALRGLTIQPAQQIGIADRTGSLAVGKDADFQVTRGDPLDPRNPPELVYIEGTLVHRLGDIR
ncbi:MAG: amidohydrolase family protein [Planctomycetes bacterium]|jgi:imidazolonepropionase-like amidohydrolase|nr:amidohydrolase family protein [Planctomycetota bacterium]